MPTEGCGGGGACDSAECGSKSAPSMPEDGVGDSIPSGVCVKCKTSPARVMSQKRYPWCVPCLHAHLVSRVKAGVRSRGPVLPGDAVAVGFTGGPASAALAHLLAQVRSARTDRPERRKTAFSMRLIHVNEGAAHGLSAEEAAAAAARVADAAAQHCGDGVDFHCVALEDVFEAEERGAGARRERLLRLLSCVGDATGRDDLIRHLRAHLLLDTAAGLGCGKLALAHTSTALAVRVIAAAAKGCGYSLPADAQLIDARYGGSRPVVFYPLREIGNHDVSLTVEHLGLRMVAPTPSEAAAGSDKRNINALAAGFVTGVQAHNPSGVANILSTVMRLQAFPWSERPVDAPAGDAPAVVEDGDASDAAHGEVLCPLCLAPLADDELPGAQGNAGSPGSALCYSCTTQIAGSIGDNGGPGPVVPLLPVGIRLRMEALALACGMASEAQAGERALTPQELRASIAANLT